MTAEPDKDADKEAGKEGDKDRAPSEERVTLVPTADGEQTLTAPNTPGGAAAGFHYTPVLMTLFGDTNPPRIIVETEELVIGRSSSADFSISDEAASRQHCKLVYSNVGKPEQRPIVNLFDLASRNGVYVNGIRVPNKVMLHDNARITIGDVQLGFYVLSFPKRALTSEATGAEKAVASPGAPTAPLMRVEGGGPPAGAPSTPSAPAVNVPIKRLALLDDDFGFASELRQKLEATKRYGVVVYRTIDAALRGFESTAPQMILLDADMPDASMADMLARLKKHERWAGVPVILIFPQFDQERIRTALKAGAQSYLTKPIENLTTLTNRIDIHMNINQMMSNVSARR